MSGLDLVNFKCGYDEYLSTLLLTLLLLIVDIFQEAKMLIARAYRHTEKVLLDNRDKLILVRRSVSFDISLYEFIIHFLTPLRLFVHSWPTHCWSVRL